MRLNAVIRIDAVTQYRVNKKTGVASLCSHEAVQPLASVATILSRALFDQIEHDVAGLEDASVVSKLAKQQTD